MPPSSTAHRPIPWHCLVWHRGSLQLEHYWPGYDRQSRTDSGGMHRHGARAPRTARRSRRGVITLAR